MSTLFVGCQFETVLPKKTRSSPVITTVAPCTHRIREHGLEGARASSLRLHMHIERRILPTSINSVSSFVDCQERGLPAGTWPCASGTLPIRVPSSPSRKPHRRTCAMPASVGASPRIKNAHDADVQTHITQRGVPSSALAPLHINRTLATWSSDLCAFALGLGVLEITFSALTLTMATITIFALLFWALPGSCYSGDDSPGFKDMLALSVHTFTTVGYGSVFPTASCPGRVTRARARRFACAHGPGRVRAARRCGCLLQLFAVHAHAGCPVASFCLWRTFGRAWPTTHTHTHARTHWQVRRCSSWSNTGSAWPLSAPSSQS